MTLVRTLLATALVASLAGAASAAPITEVEGNNTIAAAQFIPGSSFTLPVPATVFNPPGFATATVSGTGGGSDVDFYGFMSTVGGVYFDIDNIPFTFFAVLSLFDSTGTVVAFSDFSSAPDAGSQALTDSFLGVFTLPAPGTYYIAVSQFPNYPTVLTAPLVTTSLIRPDGSSGGLGVSGAAPGDSTFTSSGSGNGSPYTLHISLQNPAGQTVPEPVTLALFGAGLAAIALRTRHRNRR